MLGQIKAYNQCRHQGYSLRVNPDVYLATCAGLAADAIHTFICGFRAGLLGPIAPFHGIAADPAQISHRFSSALIGIAEMLRCAREFKIKARAVTTNWPRLAKLSLPAIAECKDSEFLILGQITDDKAVVQSPSVGRPQLLSRAEFEANWTGRLVLMPRRASLTKLARRFDITWFLQAMHKYRRLFGEVLLASFFLQLFGLVAPPFFQVIADKMLTHRGYTTLDVLIIGFIAVPVFETVLAACSPSGPLRQIEDLHERRISGSS